MLQYTSATIPYPNDPDNKKVTLEEEKRKIVSRKNTEEKVMEEHFNSSKTWFVITTCNKFIKLS